MKRRGAEKPEEQKGQEARREPEEQKGQEAWREPEEQKGQEARVGPEEEKPEEPAMSGMPERGGKQTETAKAAEQKKPAGN